jgi:hypothetical protein
MLPFDLFASRENKELTCFLVFRRRRIQDFERRKMTSLTKKVVIRERITLHAVYIVQRYSNGDGYRLFGTQTIHDPGV